MASFARASVGSKEREVVEFNEQDWTVKDAKATYLVDRWGAGYFDINDDGVIKIASTSADAAKAAIDWIKGIVAEPEQGVVYNGKVVKVVDFGAFVNFLGSKDGLVHISELAQQRVGKTSDVVKVGDAVKVKVLGFDDRGKVKLSMRKVDQATGEDIGTQRRQPEPAGAAAK